MVNGDNLLNKLSVWFVAAAALLVRRLPPPILFLSFAPNPPWNNRGSFSFLLFIFLLLLNDSVVWSWIFFSYMVFMYFFNFSHLN
jgi:hypothetical protein